MKDGFLKIGAVTPEIRPADCEYNARNIISAITDAYMRGVRVLVLPELCVTGSTCGDLFLQSTLLNGAQRALEQIINAASALDIVCAVGAPVRADGKVRNCAVVFTKGEILGIVPKCNIGAAEAKYFASDLKPIVFSCSDYPDLCFGVEIGDELYSVSPPSEMLVSDGADIILNLSASGETAGMAERRRSFVRVQSERMMCAYALAGAGNGESTADTVFSGHCIIAENGVILAESELFDNGLVTADIDLGRLAFLRRQSASFVPSHSADIREFALLPHDTVLTRNFSGLPFIPQDDEKCAERCRLILRMQSAALEKRISHTSVEKVIVGISGGLDSALALIVCSEAMLRLHRPRTDIIAVTMPCFGSSERTRRNAKRLCELIGAQLREVDITESVKRHFSDIGHDPELYNTAYENSQARERTQVLMDIANDVKGFVVGTGDLSELALGWATFAGDHISMYGVNASVPKTLVRRIVAYYASICDDTELGSVLNDILDTPVSPELLPSENGDTAQKTEDIVGPYELHDMFLYYMLRYGYSPKKLFRVACLAFNGEYGADEILKWLKVFLSRFFAQQFKRSCLPDGAATDDISLSPRGAFAMPSDVVGRLWLAEADRIELPQQNASENMKTQDSEAEDEHV